MVSDWVVDVITTLGAFLAAVFAAMFAGIVTMRVRTRTEAWKELFLEKQKASQAFIKCIGDFGVLIELGRQIHKLDLIAQEGEEGAALRCFYATQQTLGILDSYLEPNVVAEVRDRLPDLDTLDEGGFDFEDAWADTLFDMYSVMLPLFHLMDDRAREARIWLATFGRDGSAVIGNYVKAVEQIQQALDHDGRLFEGFDQDTVHEEVNKVIQDTMESLRLDLRKSARSLKGLLGPRKAKLFSA